MRRKRDRSITRAESRSILLSRVGLVVLAGAGLIAAFAAVETTEAWTKSERLALTTLPAAIGWWAIFRLPTFDLASGMRRPAFRRHRGTHYASIVSEDTWGEIATSHRLPVLAAGTFGVRRRPLLVQAALAAGGAAAAARFAGRLDRFGALTDSGLVSFLLFGPFVGLALVRAAMAATANRAIVVQRDGVVVGPGAGMFPSKHIDRQDLGQVVQVGSQVLFLTRKRECTRSSATSSSTLVASLRPSSSRGPISETNPARQFGVPAPKVRPSHRCARARRQRSSTPINCQTPTSQRSLQSRSQRATFNERDNNGEPERQSSLSLHALASWASRCRSIGGSTSAPQTQTSLQTASWSLPRS